MENRFVIILLLKTASRPGNALGSTVAARRGPGAPLRQDGLSPPRLPGDVPREKPRVARGRRRGGGRVKESGWRGQRSTARVHATVVPHAASWSHPPSPSPPRAPPASRTRPTSGESDGRTLHARRGRSLPHASAASPPHWHLRGEPRCGWSSDAARSGAGCGSQRAAESRREPRAPPLASAWPHRRRLPVLFPTGEPPNPPQKQLGGSPPRRTPGALLCPQQIAHRAAASRLPRRPCRPRAVGKQGRPQGPSRAPEPPGPGQRPPRGVALGGRAVQRGLPKTRRLLTPGLVRAPAAGWGENGVTRALSSASTGCDTGQGRGEGTRASQPAEPGGAASTTRMGRWGCRVASPAQI